MVILIVHHIVCKVILAAAHFLRSHSIEIRRQRQPRIIEIVYTRFSKLNIYQMISLAIPSTILCGFGHFVRVQFHISCSKIILYRASN